MGIPLAGDDQFVHRVVEIAADAGAAQAHGLGLQIEHLAEEAGFPQQVAIAGRIVGDLPLQLRQQTEGDAGVGGDVLMTVQAARQTAQGDGFRGGQAVQVRTAGHGLQRGRPGAGRLGPQPVGAGQQIDAGREAVHPVDEQGQAETPARHRTQGVEEAHEVLAGHHVGRVETLGAAPLQDVPRRCRPRDRHR
ncbi:MAG TPA: hypothetical protein PLX21_05875 [Rhodocyclaceae bacterium]|nr:hypothetical protein [Rhodocyclaceae bacterium]